ncbi:flagellar hook-length control protein FliK [Chitinimonas naiadis]
MIPANALVSSLQTYIKTADTPLIQVVDALQEIQQLFTVGEQVRATVTGLLPSGRFSVLIKDQLLDLNLPRNTEEGEVLDMRVLANSPRLTFLLPRQEEAATQTQTLPQAPPDTSSNVDLSDTARFLGNLLTESAQQEEQPVQPRLTSLVQPPLIETQTSRPDTIKLAEALKQALSEGGLFYESHLAQWVTGSRTLEQMLAEPQAKAYEAAKQAAEQKQTPAAAEQGRSARLPSDAKAALAGALLASDSEQTVDERARQTAGQSLLDGSTQDLDNMPPAARQLIQQQLLLIDQRQLIWQGHAWPGQPLRLEVEEDEHGRNGDEPEAAKVWRTRLHLTLPHMGSVEAIISLTDRSRVEVGFRVKQGDTAARIRVAQPRLQSQLESAGLELRANQVMVVDEESNLE